MKFFETLLEIHKFVVTRINQCWPIMMTLIDGGELYRFKLIKTTNSDVSDTPSSSTNLVTSESEFANISTPELISLREEDVANNEHLIMIVCLNRNQIVGLSNFGKLFWLKEPHASIMILMEDKDVTHSKIEKISGDGCDSFVIHYGRFIVIEWILSHSSVKNVPCVFNNNCTQPVELSNNVPYLIKVISQPFDDFIHLINCFVPMTLHFKFLMKIVRHLYFMEVLHNFL